MANPEEVLCLPNCVANFNWRCLGLSHAPSRRKLSVQIAQEMRFTVLAGLGTTDISYCVMRA
jgi:hypothetical protein